MKIRELTAAVADLDDALTYYGGIQPRLAAALLKEVEAAKQSIVRFPLAWKPLEGGLRAVRLHRFPYSVIYRQGPDEILIVAYVRISNSVGCTRGLGLKFFGENENGMFSRIRRMRARKIGPVRHIH